MIVLFLSVDWQDSLETCTPMPVPFPSHLSGFYRLNPFTGELSFLRSRRWVAVFILSGLSIPNASFRYQHFQSC